MEAIVNSRKIKASEAAPYCVSLVSGASGTTSAPTQATDGLQVDPHAASVGLEVEVNGGDGTSSKAIKLWVYSRSFSKWYAPTEGTVSDLHSKPGMQLSYVLADPWLYERIYLEITTNTGSGTINAKIISR
tara:strand:+ start:304 stop:696 length:393 start_codon:yes stop_codon:yes gene_type:complete